MNILASLLTLSPSSTMSGLTPRLAVQETPSLLPNGMRVGVCTSPLLSTNSISFFVVEFILHTSINIKLYDIVVTHSDWSTAECPCPAFLSHKHSNPRVDLGHQPDPLALRVQMGYF